MVRSICLRLRQGFSLLETMVVVAILAMVTVGAGIYWSWGAHGAKQQAYANALEALLLRGLDYAQTLEQPIAVCLVLSEGCAAEGMMYPRADQALAETAQEWHLLESLPVKDGVFIRSNFANERLIIQAGGKSVRQPGSLYVCAVQAPQAYVLVISRSGRITSKVIEGPEVVSACDGA